MFFSETPFSAPFKILNGAFSQQPIFIIRQSPKMHFSRSPWRGSYLYLITLSRFENIHEQLLNRYCFYREEGKGCSLLSGLIGETGRLKPRAASPKGVRVA